MVKEFLAPGPWADLLYFLYFVAAFAAFFLSHFWLFLFTVLFFVQQKVFFVFYGFWFIGSSHLLVLPSFLFYFGISGFINSHVSFWVVGSLFPPPPFFFFWVIGSSVEDVCLLETWFSPNSVYTKGSYKQELKRV